MKIALCLSGHARTHETVHKFWQKNLFAPEHGHDVDVFIHTWDTIGPRWFGDGRSEAMNPLPRADFHSGIVESPPFDINSMRDLWNPISMVVEDYEQYHDSFANDVIPVLEERNRRDIPAGFEHHHPLSVRSMLYKRAKCNELKTQYEVLTGIEYDLVIQARPDVALTEPLSQVVMNTKDRIFFHNSRSVTREPEICDFGAIGTSLRVNFYCDLYYVLDNELRNVGEDFFQFLNPHKMYVRYFLRNHMNYEERDLGLCIVRDSGQILGWPHAANIVRTFEG